MTRTKTTIQLRCLNVRFPKADSIKLKRIINPVKCKKKVKGTQSLQEVDLAHTPKDCNQIKIYFHKLGGR